MLCSKCSETIKPIVVFDIDGTLGDYHQHFYIFAQNYVGYALRPFYDGSCELHDWWKMDLEFYRVIKLAYRQGGMKRSMPLFPGACDLVNYVKSQYDAEIWLTTTRPYLRLDNIDPDTRFWLEKSEIPYDGLLYDENKYERLAERVDVRRVVSVLEDLPEQYVVAADCFGRTVPMLKAAQHNVAARMNNWIPSLTVADSLVDAKHNIIDRMALWHAAVEA